MRKKSNLTRYQPLVKKRQWAGGRINCRTKRRHVWTASGTILGCQLKKNVHQLFTEWI